jgi:hypothetical protein
MCAFWKEKLYPCSKENFDNKCPNFKRDETIPKTEIKIEDNNE